MLWRAIGYSETARQDLITCSTVRRLLRQCRHHGHPLAVSCRCRRRKAPVRKHTAMCPREDTEERRVEIRRLLEEGAPRWYLAARKVGPAVRRISVTALPPDDNSSHSCRGFSARGNRHEIPITAIAVSTSTTPLAAASPARPIVVVERNLQYRT
jgi:hypothetical protein